jgi:hypothetical protein
MSDSTVWDEKYPSKPQFISALHQQRSNPAQTQVPASDYPSPAMCCTVPQAEGDPIATGNCGRAIEWRDKTFVLSSILVPADCSSRPQTPSGYLASSQLCQSWYLSSHSTNVAIFTASSIKSARRRERDLMSGVAETWVV